MAATDLTKGPITKQLILFALPLFASSLIQLLYSTVDLIFVGNFVGTEAAAAVGASSLIVTCFVGMFTGLGTGAGVVIARHFGAGHHDRLTMVMHTVVTFGLVAGIVLIPICIALSPTFLTWLNTPEEIFSDAVVYVRIYFVGLVPMILYNMGGGVQRAIGDSFSPMVCQLVGGIANVLANVLFVCLLQLGVRGSALATLASQSIACILILIRLRMNKDPYRLHPKSLHIHKVPLREVLEIGIPSGVQAVVITFSNLVVQSSINSLGITDIAAFTAWFKVENFIYFPVVSLGQAATIFVGQCIGAGNIARTRKGVRAAIISGCAVTAAIAVVLYLTGPWLYRLFVDDADVIDVGMQIASVILPCYILYVFLEVISSSIRGAGHPNPPMAIILTLVCGMRILLLSVPSGFFTSAKAVAYVYPISWSATVVALLIYYFAVLVRKHWSAYEVQPQEAS